ncbi:hypothetical protein [Lysobacter sp. ESA13C]|uniref:hypothetical protein n=1 Tax=Lysobacter sp. ESA13C TaxID=2862676 RepID=UPI001CBDC46F|nr:hypothetical protein [Lysobacter sp. ESA13C]
MRVKASMGGGGIESERLAIVRLLRASTSRSDGTMDALIRPYRVSSIIAIDTSDLKQRSTFEHELDRHAVLGQHVRIQQRAISYATCNQGLAACRA